MPQYYRQFYRLTQPETGQAGLLAIAISMIIMLVLVGGTLSNLSAMDSKRNIVDRRSMQAYYVAQAGLQEALATRMLPRSNYLSFISPAGAPAAVQPYYSNSGLVFQQPGTRTGLIGAYRYVIVGGDPSRKADGSYYGIPQGPPFSPGPDVTSSATPTPRLVTFQSNPPASPFFVLSNGITCVKNVNTAGQDQGVDQFIGPANLTLANQLTLSGGLVPQCQTGYSPQEVTLVAQVSLEQESGALDKVNSVRMYRDRTKLSLPGSAFVPGQGWVSSANTVVNFDTAWSSQSTNAGLTPGRPTRLVFFKFGPNNIYKSVDLTGGSPVTVPGTVPIDASMMLDFDGPIDYRSLSSNLGGSMSYFYDSDLAGCKGGASTNCAIKMFAKTNNVQYTGMMVVPIMPYLTKVLLLAPLGNNLSSGNAYYLNIYTGNVRSFSYAPGSSAGGNTAFTINFTTQ